jgi:hypothetical protein
VIAPWLVRRRQAWEHTRYQADMQSWRDCVAENLPAGARRNFEARMDEGNYDNLNIQLARSIDSRIGDMPKQEVSKREFMTRRRRNVERKLEWPDERPIIRDPTRSSWDYYQENGYK